MQSIRNICVTRVHVVTVVKNPTFAKRRVENRKSHGLCFCLSGRMVYRMGDKEYVSDRRHVLLLPRGAS